MNINNLFKDNFKLDLNKFIQEKDGLILLISTENYQQFLKPILSSANLFAKKWGVLLVKIGSYELNTEYTTNQLLSTQIDLNNLNLENINDNQLRSFSANIRGPILNELCKIIHTKRIIYTDVDALIVKDISKLSNFLPNSKKIIFRKTKKNLLDLMRPNAKHYLYKSGCIVLCTKEKYLSEDLAIHEICELYAQYCWHNKFIWGADQEGLKYLVDNYYAIYKYLYETPLFVDWSLKPWTYIWAAKGFRKNSLIWQLISRVFILLNSKENLNLNLQYLEFYISSEKIKKLIIILKIIIYPLIFIRFEIIHPFIKISNYCFKLSLRKFKK